MLYLVEIQGLDESLRKKEVYFSKALEFPGPALKTSGHFPRGPRVTWVGCGPGRGLKRKPRVERGLWSDHREVIIGRW